MTEPQMAPYGWPYRYRYRAGRWTVGGFGQIVDQAGYGPPPDPGVDVGIAALRAITAPGASYKTAAAELGVTEATIRRRLHNLYAQLGVATGAQAVAEAWEEYTRGYCTTCRRDFRPEDTRRHNRSLLHRFFSHVEVTPSGCWEWRGGRYPTGYGRISVGGRQTYVHRAAFELFVGPIPPGLSVLHRCDNPPCCNPEHLFTGTDQDNTDDAIAKGRRRARTDRAA